MEPGRQSRPWVPLTDVRGAFARLIAQGVSNSEACRPVGINRRTGTRWRHGRDIPISGGRTLHYPPVVTTRSTTPISARFLSEDERIVIADLRRTGATVRTIAPELDRSPSTVSRELRRNADPAGRYRPSAVHRAAVQRRARRRARRIDRDDALRIRVQLLLAKRWSPEQISRTLSVDYADDVSRQLATESIYQAIYDASSGLVRDRTCMPLRTRRRRRKPHRRPDARRPGGLVSMTMIDDRPVSAADRREIGHWESQCFCQAAGASAGLGGSW
jgi:IS30 family transposase